MAHLKRAVALFAEVGGRPASWSPRSGSSWPGERQPPSGDRAAVVEREVGVRAGGAQDADLAGRDRRHRGGSCPGRRAQVDRHLDDPVRGLEVGVREIGVLDERHDVGPGLRWRRPAHEQRDVPLGRVVELDLDQAGRRRRVDDRARRAVPADLQRPGDRERVRAAARPSGGRRGTRVMNASRSADIATRTGRPPGSRDRRPAPGPWAPSRPSCPPSRRGRVRERDRGQRVPVGVAAVGEERRAGVHLVRDVGARGARGRRTAGRRCRRGPARRWSRRGRRASSGRRARGPPPSRRGRRRRSTRRRRRATCRRTRCCPGASIVPAIAWMPARCEANAGSSDAASATFDSGPRVTRVSGASLAPARRAEELGRGLVARGLPVRRPAARRRRTRPLRRATRAGTSGRWGPGSRVRRRPGPPVCPSAARTRRVLRIPGTQCTSPVAAMVTPRTSTAGSRSRTSSANRSSPARSVSTTTGNGWSGLVAGRWRGARRRGFGDEPRRRGALRRGRRRGRRCVRLAARHDEERHSDDGQTNRSVRVHGAILAPARYGPVTAATAPRSNQIRSPGEPLRRRDPTGTGSGPPG